MNIVKNTLKKFELDLCTADAPPEEILNKRRFSLSKFSVALNESPMENSLPDTEFSKNYRVPFPFIDQILKLNPSSLLKNNDISEHDAFSSYGVNVFGKEVYEKWISNSVQQNEKYGFFLNSYHPITLENVKILKEISGMDSVTFHMSGTEAVLNACRLAKFNSGKKYIAKFKDAYHGWANLPDLKEISNLKELKKLKNCAALLINP
ncbi:MAG: aminotransferase class III-fold pyridoxal phosphate-dependent enzyme, partial [Spirochaetia bacterium]|nr:aminotransferase class III-fold pyridoxal phosphate-dependent enzyme [Spirochaetia bacterium]